MNFPRDSHFSIESEGKVIGCFEVLRSYPTEQTAMIGLLKGLVVLLLTTAKCSAESSLLTQKQSKTFPRILRKAHIVGVPNSFSHAPIFRRRTFEHFHWKSCWQEMRLAGAFCLKLSKEEAIVLPR